MFGAFYQSGQSCIGVQRIIAHAQVYDALKGRLVARTSRLVAGDPKDEATFIGPMISTVCRQEAFGPVAVLSRFEAFGDALREVNDSAFGLQAGIFTRELYHMQQAWDELEVGGVIIGDVPSWRVDNMPYGGVKDSGLGREGVRFAMEDMTEIRNLVIRTPAR